MARRLAVVPIPRLDVAAQGLLPAPAARRGVAVRGLMMPPARVVAQRLGPALT